VKDQRTGYYLSGHDWPAIRNEIPLAEIYKALEGIDDAVVEAALHTLQTDEAPADSIPTQPAAR
jgi:hypothetical protein